METLARHLAVMGTSLAIAVSAPGRDAALEASEAAVRAIEAVDGLLSTWREDTPLARLNAAPPGVPHETPAELVALLKSIFEWSERTGGAFDPTVLPLVRAWGIRGAARVPNAMELHAARRATGLALFSFDESPSSPSLPSPARRVARLDAAAGIDEGAWGKGWALDRAAEALRAAGITSFTIDLGGQLLVAGEGRIVAVADPRNRSRMVAALRLKDASASTSGNSERGLDVNGRRIGHLLDPRTGEPAPDFGSVTVVAPSALVADVLSTALFVLGPKDGMALSERLRGEGMVHETLFLFEGEDGNGLRAAASPGMKRLLTPAEAGIRPTEPSLADAAPGPGPGSPSSHAKKFSEGAHR